MSGDSPTQIPDLTRTGKDSPAIFATAPAWRTTFGTTRWGHQETLVTIELHPHNSQWTDSRLVFRNAPVVTLECDSRSKRFSRPLGLLIQGKLAVDLRRCEIILRVRSVPCETTRDWYG
jgi:hypothetical protein